MFADYHDQSVELGEGYGGEYNDETYAVIDEAIIPHFASGDFASGLQDGIVALTKALTGAATEAETTSHAINHALGCDAEACSRRRLPAAN